MFHLNFARFVLYLVAEQTTFMAPRVQLRRRGGAESARAATARTARNAKLARTNPRTAVPASRSKLATIGKTSWQQV